MAVAGTNSVSSNNSSTKTTSTTAQQKATLNYNNFLQLLVAQMKNQDPTSPMDASQQISQLASFSQVEQQIQTNNRLDSLLAGGNIMQAANYIGKYVKSTDGSIAGQVASVKVYSDGVIATTKEGKDVLIAAGVTVSDQPLTATTTDTDKKS